MAEIIKVLGNEQSFTTPNTFSATTSNIIAGYNLVRIVNSSNASGIVTITNTASSTQIGTLTILPYTEVIIKKQSNNTLTASSFNILGVSIAYSQ